MLLNFFKNYFYLWPEFLKIQISLHEIVTFDGDNNSYGLNCPTWGTYVISRMAIARSSNPLERQSYKTQPLPLK